MQNYEYFLNKSNKIVTNYLITLKFAIKLAYQ